MAASAEADASTPSDQSTNAPPPTTQPPSQPAAPSQAPSQAAKPTIAELKAKKAAEKAARRGKVLAAKQATTTTTTTEPTSTNKPTFKPEAGKHAKARDDTAATSTQSRPGHQRRPSAGRGAGSGGASGHASAAKHGELANKTETGPETPLFLSHLPLLKIPSLLSAPKAVHPAVLAVGQQMAHFVLVDNAARCKAMLQAFKRVIKDYESPPGHVFSRHFVPQVLSDQIEWLIECRPMCFAMGTAIRKLKHWVSALDLHISDDAAKVELLDRIDLFIQEKIDLAELIVTRNAAAMILDGDTVLTYGHSRLVRKSCQLAWREHGVRFQVAVVDDAPWHRSGQDLAKTLRADGIRVFYYPTLAALPNHIKTASRVLLGAEAFFENGYMYAPIGTCDVALAAADCNVPVLALCETVHFDGERVAVDSLTYNERVRGLVDQVGGEEGEVVEECLFDATPEKYLTVVITEYETVNGNSPPSAIGSILRKQEAFDEPV